MEVRDGVNGAILFKKDYLLPIVVDFRSREEKGVGILVDQRVFEVHSGRSGIG